MIDIKKCQKIINKKYMYLLWNKVAGKNYKRSEIRINMLLDN